MARLDGVGHLEREGGSAGRDAWIVAVDEELDRVLGGIRLGGGAGAVEVLPRLDDLGAECAHPLDLARLAWRDVNTMAGIPSARAAYATPWPKLPAETQAIGRSGPILPSPARALTATHVPRPLNERIGLTVSTLTMTGTPRRRDRPVVDELRGVGKARVDPVTGRADGVGREGRDADQRGLVAPTLFPAHTETPEGTAGP